MEHGFDDAFKALGASGARARLYSYVALLALPASGTRAACNRRRFTAGKPHIVAPSAGTLRRPSASACDGFRAGAAPGSPAGYFARATQSASSGGESFTAMSS